MAAINTNTIAAGSITEFDPYGAASDAIAPTVVNISPANGQGISRTQAIQFDVLDTSNAFRRIFVVAEFDSLGLFEVVHDGSSFKSTYSVTSTRSVIANGYRFSLLRSGGWPAPVRIRVYPIDAAGNEA